MRRSSERFAVHTKPWPGTSAASMTDFTTSGDDKRWRNGLPVWFGPSERPLFGWLHVPEDGMASGAVVLCPPLAHEHLLCYTTFQRLAQELASRGLAALRFDYDGTGDSAGRQSDPGRLAAWVNSTHEAIRYCRALGTASLGVVGMRLGATIASLALGEVQSASKGPGGPADALVLWDPCVSGRSFLREQQLLARAGGSASSSPATLDHETTETPGFAYDKQTAREISSASITSTSGALSRRSLVLTRADRAPNVQLAARLSSTSEVQWLPAEGQESLLDVRAESRGIPEKTVTVVSNWLASSLSGPNCLRRCLRAPGACHSYAAVARDSQGQAIVERSISFGSANLFGITCEAPVPIANAPRPVFLNVGTLHHIGPGRMWVDLARAWAEEGFTSIRIDMSGTGDSPARSGQERDRSFPSGALQDLADAARSVAPDDPSNVVFIGLSSGGYHAICGGIAEHARAVLLLNPALTLEVSLLVGNEHRHTGTRDMVPERLLFRLPVIPPLLRRRKSAHRVPALLKWLAYRVVLRKPPVSAIDALAKTGVKVLMIMNDQEFKDLVGMCEHRAAKRLLRRGDVNIKILDDFDHVLQRQSDRTVAAEIMTAQLLEWFAPQPGNTGRDGDQQA